MDGIIGLHNYVRKMLDRFTLSPPHGIVLGQILLWIFLIFPFILKGIFKGLVVQNGVICEIFEPFSHFSSKCLGKQTNFNIIVVYFLQVYLV